MNKAKVGNKIEYWYNKKFYNGEIIDKTKENVMIKLWISILNPKILNINYPNDWKSQIENNRIIPKAKNNKFPLWIKMCQLCIIHQSLNSQIIAKIAKYKDGKYMTLFYIKYPSKSFETKSIQTVIINIDNIKNKLSLKSTYINYRDEKGQNNVLYPYLDQIEIDSHYLKINDINNNKLIKSLWKTKTNNNNTLKSTDQQIIAHTHHHDNNCCDDNRDEYITTSRLQYGIILECESFPFDINRLIISFLAQRMIYICPPTPCNKLESIKVPQMWQFVEKDERRDPFGRCSIEDNNDHWQLAIIGCEFKMNCDLLISGFELNNIELLGIHSHKIYLNNLQCRQLQLKQELRNAQFVFKHNKLFKLKENETYFIRIKLNANVPCYQCHLPPMNVKGFNNYNNEGIENWKCFKYIKWKKFNDNKEFKRSTLRLEWFPHLAFLLS